MYTHTYICIPLFSKRMEMLYLENNANSLKKGVKQCFELTCLAWKIHENDIPHLSEKSTQT